MVENEFNIGKRNSCIMQCDTQLWNHNIEFARWDDMPVNSPKRPPYCNSTSVSISTNRRSLRHFIQIGPPSAEKKFKMADFSGPVMGSLKRPCTTCYRSSIATIARNCLLFEKIALFCILATDRQTDKQMDSTDALSRSRCRERRLNNIKKLKLIGGLK